MSVSTFASNFEDYRAELIDHSSDSAASRRKKRIITFIQNTAESFFRFASLAYGAHQIYTRIEQLKDVLGARAIKLAPYRYRLIEFRLSP